MVAADAVFTYLVAATAFMANGLFLTTSSVNALVYSPQGSSEAAAAGFILLSMVFVRLTIPALCFQYHTNTCLPDCLDLLLWLPAAGQPSPLH